MHPKSCDEKNNLSSLLQNRNEKGKLITDYYFWDTECTDVACVCARIRISSATTSVQRSKNRPWKKGLFEKGL